MEVLQQYLCSDTSKHFTSHYQDFPYDPYLLNTINTATYIKTNRFKLFYYKYQSHKLLADIFNLLAKNKMGEPPPPPPPALTPGQNVVYVSS